MKVSLTKLADFAVCVAFLCSAGLLTWTIVSWLDRVTPGSNALPGALGPVLAAVVGLLLVSAICRRLQRAGSESARVRRAETEASVVLNTAVDAIISIDERGIIESFNPAAEKAFGYSQAEAIGQNVNLLMTDPDRSEHDRHLERYRKTGERRIIGIGREVICRRKDGTRFPADLAVAEYRVDGRRRFTGFIRNIAERKDAEAYIRKQAALLDMAREALIVRDLDDHITFWNHGAELLYGWTRADALGRPLEELVGGDPALFEKIRDSVLAGDEWDGELTNSTMSGKEVIVESRWSLLRDSAGQPAAILVIDVDVTEKSRRERQALRAQRLESIGTLAGGIAHDLNNMLTPILMSAKLLARDRPPAERGALLANIQASAERGAEMVRQLLAFTGGAETERVRVDLRDVIREIRTLLEHTLPKSIAIETSVDADLRPIAGDSTQLSQVLMNLCVNARDAMPAGGRLTIAARNALLDAQAAAAYPELHAGEWVVVTVSDTGAGIPPAVLDRIFDPFFTTKEQGKGTGLGLATALGIVRSHGGTVSVASKAGHGAQFTIYLPTEETAPHQAPQTAETSPERGAGQMILVVDDEDLVLTAARAALEDAGYRVVTAQDGPSATALLARHRGEVRAALVDMMMPGMDGPATMQALRRIDAALPIIACSGLRVAEEDAPVIAECTRAFLSKPYNDVQLLNTLAAVLGEPSP